MEAFCKASTAVNASKAAIAVNSSCVANAVNASKVAELIHVSFRRQYIHNNTTVLDDKVDFSSDYGSLLHNNEAVLG